MNRIFIAYDIDKETKSKIKEISRIILKNIKHKTNAVNPKNYHITIKYLGNIKETKNLEDLINHIEINKRSITLPEISFFPENNPKVIFFHVKLNPETYQKTIHLNKEIISRLVHEDIHKESHKEYIPHITIARTKQKLTKEEINTIKHIHFEEIKTQLKSITIYNSILTFSGPRYQKVFRKELQ